MSNHCKIINSVSRLYSPHFFHLLCMKYLQRVYSFSPLHYRLQYLRYKVLPSPAHKVGEVPNRLAYTHHVHIGVLGTGGQLGNTEKSQHVRQCKIIGNSKIPCKFFCRGGNIERILVSPWCHYP